MAGAASTSSRGLSIAWIGRFGGPLLALVVYFLLGAGAESTLSEAGRATAAIGVLMATLWMTEAMPLPATSLLPLVLFPAAGVMDMRAAAAPYADPVIFLFMGGFLLALAMERWGLHKRIALLTVLIVGTQPKRMVAGFMGATAVMSMWISNTATVVMMLPIAVSVITLLSDRLKAAGDASGAGAQGDLEAANFASTLLLGIAYSARIGGVGTLIGTPPNAFLRGFLSRQYGIEIGFGEWMLVGVPFATVFCIIVWVWLTSGHRPIRLRELPGGLELIRAELAKLGRPARAEWLVFAIFMITALSWMFAAPVGSWLESVAGETDGLLGWLAGMLGRLSDPAIAIAAGLLLFAIPVDPKRGVFLLDWESAVKLPWGVLLLFGGGLSLAGAVSSSGLDAWIGGHVEALGALPPALLVALVAALVIAVTEMTSNTATAAAFLPILGGVAIGIDVAPLMLVVPAAMAASCAFMMPVATPPNAIVFGSGRVAIRDMVAAGAALHPVGIALVTLVAFTLAKVLG